MKASRAATPTSQKAGAVSDRRGCEWDDYGISFTIILARADAERVAGAIAKLDGRKARAADPHGSRPKHPERADLVFRHVGQPYSVVLRGGYSDDDLPANLARRLRTRVIALYGEDTSGWIEYRVFDRGRNVETYTFGPDYSDELAELAKEMGEDVPEIMPSDSGRPWDHSLSKDGDSFKFRSTLRKVDAALVKRGDEMIDHAFRTHDAWLPGWAHFPWSGKKGRSAKKGSPAGEFEGAFIVAFE